MAGARGVARNSKPARPARGDRRARTLAPCDLVAEEQLAKLDAALVVAVADAIAAKDVPTLLKLHAHFDDRRKRPADEGESHDADEDAAGGEVGPDEGALASFGAGRDDA